jgi:hypothetical protein
MKVEVGQIWKENDTVEEIEILHVHTNHVYAVYLHGNSTPEFFTYNYLYSHFTYDRRSR